MSQTVMETNLNIIFWSLLRKHLWQYSQHYYWNIRSLRAHGWTVTKSIDPKTQITTTILGESIWREGIKLTDRWAFLFPSWVSPQQLRGDPERLGLDLEIIATTTFESSTTIKKYKVFALDYTRDFSRLRHLKVKPQD